MDIYKELENKIFNQKSDFVSIQFIQIEAYKQGHKKGFDEGYEAGKKLHEDNCVKVKEDSIRSEDL